MGVGAGLYMCDVVKKFTFAISSPDEFLSYIGSVTAHMHQPNFAAWYKEWNYGTFAPLHFGSLLNGISPAA